MGCAGCELFPSPGWVLKAIDKAVVDSGVRINSHALYKELVNKLTVKIHNPKTGHKNTVNTTNIWHLRRYFWSGCRVIMTKRPSSSECIRTAGQARGSRNLLKNPDVQKGNDIYQVLSRYMLSINSLKEIREISELNVTAQFGQHSGSKIFF